MLAVDELEVLLNDCFIDWLPSGRVNIKYLGVSIEFNRIKKKVVKATNIITGQPLITYGGNDFEYVCDEYTIGINRSYDTIKLFKSFDYPIAGIKLIEVVIEDMEEFGFNVYYSYYKDAVKVANGLTVEVCKRQLTKSAAGSR